MSCCLPPGRLLTRQERAAIARLRERRAAGLSPTSAAHSAAAPRHDPLVTFYAAAAARSAAASKTPRRPLPRKPPLPKKPPSRKPRQPTAHQLKKNAALRRVHRRSPRIAAPPPPPKAMRERTLSSSEKPGKGAMVPFKSTLRTRRKTEASQGSSSSSSEEDRQAPFVSTSAKAVAVWQKLRSGRGGSDEGTGRQTQTEGTGTGTSGPQALKENMRKKWDDVVTRFGGNSAKGERFVLKERPDPSDAGESNNDIYFQKLMTMDS